MLPNPCCSCPIATDDFHRAGPGFGAGWVTRLGADPTIIANELDFATPGMVRFETAHPDGATGRQHVRVRVKLVSTTAGLAIAQVIVGYLDDDHWFGAHLYYDASGCKWLVVGVQEFGAETFGGAPGALTCVPLDGLTLGEWHTLTVCFLPGVYPVPAKIRASVTLANGKTFAVQQSIDMASGDKVGLRTVQGHAVIDDFYFGHMTSTTGSCKKACTDCNTPCLISADNFNRADSTDLGCLWFEVGSVAAIVGQELVISSASATVKHLVFHPQEKRNHQVTVRMKDVAGVKGRVYIGTGYMEVEPAAGGHTLRLYQAVTGTLLKTASDTVPNNAALYLDLTLCWDGHLLTATVTRGGAVHLCANDTVPDVPGSIYASLGSGSVGGVTFDDFVFSKTLSTEEPADSCDRCHGCPVECTECCSGVSDVWALDITGGWTNVECAACVDVGGTYLVDYTTGCQWTGGDDMCSESYGTHCVPPNLTILYALHRNPVTGKCYFDCTAATTILDVTDDCTHLHSEDAVGAYYKSDEFDVGDCTDEILLTKVSETVGWPCGGALGPTITARQV